MRATPTARAKIQRRFARSERAVAFRLEQCMAAARFELLSNCPYLRSATSYSIHCRSEYFSQRSMRHQCRDRHGLKHAARDPSQNALFKTRMAVASHDDQIETGVCRDREDGGLDIGAVRSHALDARGKAMPRQMHRQGRRGRIRRCLRLVDADDGDGLRVSAVQRGYGQADC